MDHINETLHALGEKLDALHGDLHDAIQDGLGPAHDISAALSDIAKTQRRYS